MWLVLALERFFVKSTGGRAVLKRQGRPRAARRLVGSLCRENEQTQNTHSPILPSASIALRVFPQVVQ